MKRRIHLYFLVLQLIVIMPGALFGMLIAFAAACSGFELGFQPTDFLAIALLLTPAFLGCWGAKLLFKLYAAGFLTQVRRPLLEYYSAVAIYCGMWLVSTFSRDGTIGALFRPQEQVGGLILLLMPLLATLVMTPDLLPGFSNNETAEQAVIENRAEPRASA